MSEPKQVKVDNWGIYFLQRLKHFFNRTDYCDLTLQFQDNAQLKVHRLVLSACTEYFELLERTCEMYEDCLVMPDDLQADVVVPIVNFMYTGQLEFRMEILERLHATSEIMNMPVLTKLLDSHRPKYKTNNMYPKRQNKHVSIKLPSVEIVNLPSSSPATAAAAKRSFAKAFDKTVQNVVYRDKKYCQLSKPASSMNVTNGGLYRAPSPNPLETFGKAKPQKPVPSEPRPTRYELPEELDSDNIFENSFCNVSYSSQPLMVHPETVKQYAKRPRQDKGQASTSKKSRSNTLDIVECKKIVREPGEIYFEESESATLSDETQMFKPSMFNVKTETDKDPNKLFDQLLDRNEEHSTKVTIETTKNNKAGANLDHAKIISEVLKKYPHLVKSNKNIKLKIFNNATPNKGVSKKQKPSPQPIVDKSQFHNNDANATGFTYETDVLDSKQAAKLIAMGAENIDGPWICLICGTPGKALHFTSYYKFRRHLVEIHNEKPVLNICEHCGQRMSKRNHLLHHMYTKHGVEPPPTHHFPKCNNCNYVALTEALLVKHKLSHTENKGFRCNVCPSSFHSSNLLLAHIQNTGHKYIADRKHSHQCIYCLRVFIRENNLYAHLKTHHKEDAIKDGIIDESDDESRDEKEDIKEVKNEPAQNDYDDNHMEYHIEQKPDGNIQLIQKKPAESSPSTPLKQKILNSDYPSESPKAPTPKAKVTKAPQNIQAEHEQDIISTYNDNEEEIVMIDNNEYIMSGNRLILRKGAKQPSDEYILSDLIDDKSEESQQSIEPSTSMDYATILNSNENVHQANIMLKNAGNLSQSIPIYVSNEEEYKALMSSNHNIIFDSTDANKTLTVLTTPDAATLDDTSINLDNTQNNDMMIIHEDYPMNVTEAVVTDNSNIVVVYSQQVGGSNKEYQLLTTQALGPQYAQSAAILTQNYETVSTSSPVMSAHILDSQDGTWQGDIHENIANQQSEASAVIETIVHPEEAQTSNAPETIEDMTDLPQVELIPNPPEPVHYNPNENITSESLETEVIKDCQDMSMEVGVSIVENKEDFIPVAAVPENIVLPEVEETVEDTESQETEPVPVSENILEGEQPAEIIHMEVDSSDTNENMISINSENSNENENINLDIQNSDTNENIISMDSQNPEINESEANINDPVMETASVEESTETPTTCTEVVKSPAPEIVEQIQSLASEWSEENLETPSQDSTEETDNQEQIITEDADDQEHIEEEAENQEHMDTDEADNQEHIDPELKSDIVEESVENIQQEIKKQMLETNASAENVESLNSPANNDLPATKEDATETITVDPQVKISSLLNDWDDNEDFQEVNNIESSATEPIKEDAVQSEFHNTDVSPVNEQELVADAVLETAENEPETSTAPNDEVIENIPTDPETNPPLENETVAKQDNIKSLVSDWDDDDEENKE